MKLSVIIPTLNEAEFVATAIDSARRMAGGAPVEIIVADCGSADRTVAIARSCEVLVEKGPMLTSRARACNAGAAAATGDTLLFLHADSRPPPGYDMLIAKALADPANVGGAFEFALDGPERRLRLVEWINRLRYRLRRRYFGDQGIFVRRPVFERLGGFPDESILEDAHFCATLLRSGGMPLVEGRMPTSPRRFYNGGILRTLMFDCLIILGDLVGSPLDAPARFYRRDNLARAGRRPDRESPSEKVRGYGSIRASSLSRRLAGRLRRKTLAECEQQLR